MPFRKNKDEFQEVPLRGPEGKEGERGRQGVQGIQGQRGTAGSDATDVPDALRLRIYREEVRDNITAFGRAIASMWKAILVVLLLGLLSFAGTIWNRQEILNSRENGYKGRMIVCLTVIIDNDRTFDMPPQCLDSNVLVYYPSEACIQLDRPDECGIRNDET